VTVTDTTGSMGQLQIIAGGVIQWTILSLPAAGVSVRFTGGVTGWDISFVAGALMQALANRVTTTRAANSSDRGIVFRFIDIILR
jgi:predicted phage tail protein